MTMVAKRSLKLTNAELLHTLKCHVCPALMKHLHNVASDDQKLREMDMKCHCCIEEKMKHAPKPPRSIAVINVPIQVVSMDTVGPFQVKSIQKCSNGRAFIENYTNMQYWALRA